MGQVVSVSFVLTDELISFDANQQPPDSSRAIELLIEFYALFGLGLNQPGRKSESRFETLPRYMAAFLAALALPLYRSHKLEPQLTMATLARQTLPIRHEDATRIQQYGADLMYYLTLSASSPNVQSILWSVFLATGYLMQPCQSVARRDS